jgi:hypothetical protein
MSIITTAQLRRLQVVYAQFAKRAIELDDSREARLRWASEQVGRTIHSYSDLSRDEAKKLIDLCQGAMGIAPSKSTRRRTRVPRIRDEARAHAAGTEGRRDGEAGVRSMATQEDLDRIQDAIQRLGWTREQFESWLRSPRSPLARKVAGTRIAPVDPKLSTWWETNRVWYALKSMLKSRGLWRA